MRGIGATLNQKSRPPLLVLAILATSAPAAAASYFTDRTSALGAQLCGGTGCYTNYTALADLDGDGDLEVIFPNANGYFVKAEPQPLAVLRNDQNLTFSDMSATFGLAGWIRQVAIGDVDGDGDVDMFAPDAWGGPDAFFINDGRGGFTNDAARSGGSHSRAGSTRFGDVDGDGDLDLLVGDWGASPPKGAWSIHLYLNDGSGTFTLTDLQLPSVARADGTGPVDLDLLDTDRDFDLDLLIDAHNGNAQVWINDGSGTFSDASATFPNQAAGGLHYGPAVCDVDGDGDLDVWIDNGTSTDDEQLLINDGTGVFADETAKRVRGNDSGADDNALSCVDIDGDGDFDVAIASLSGNERVLLNDGAGNFALLADAFPTVNDSTLWFDFGDLDGDGKLDCVTAQGESGSFLNRLYMGAGAALSDVRGPVLRAIESVPDRHASERAVVRFGVSDNVTTDIGPRLSAIYAEITSGSEDSGAPVRVDARFIGGDLFRVVLPAQMTNGAVSWRVCATDRRANTTCSTPATYHVTGAGEASPQLEAEPAAIKRGCGCDTAARQGTAPALGVMGLLAFALLTRRAPFRSGRPLPKKRCDLPAASRLGSVRALIRRPALGSAHGCPR